MKNLKRLMALLLAVCLMACLCACGSNDNSTDDNSTGTTENSDATDKTDATDKNDSTDNTEETKKPSHTVTVVDEGNNPVAGAWVQLCLDSCVPAVTNEEGIAVFFLEEADYKVSFMVMPEGYDYSTEEQEWHFDAGKNSMTIVLKAVE